MIMIEFKMKYKKSQQLRATRRVRRTTRRIRIRSHSAFDISQYFSCTFSSNNLPLIVRLVFAYLMLNNNVHCLLTNTFNHHLQELPTRQQTHLDETNESGVINQLASRGALDGLDDDELSTTLARSMHHRPGEVQNLYYPETTTITTETTRPQHPFNWNHEVGELPHSLYHPQTAKVLLADNNNTTTKINFNTTYKTGGPRDFGDQAEPSEVEHQLIHVGASVFANKSNHIMVGDDHKYDLPPVPMQQHQHQQYQQNHQPGNLTMSGSQSSSSASTAIDLKSSAVNNTSQTQSANQSNSTSVIGTDKGGGGGGGKFNNGMKYMKAYHQPSKLVKLVKKPVESRPTDDGRLGKIMISYAPSSGTGASNKKGLKTGSARGRAAPAKMLLLSNWQPEQPQEQYILKNSNSASIKQANGPLDGKRFVDMQAGELPFSFINFLRRPPPRGESMGDGPDDQPSAIGLETLQRQLQSSAANLIFGPMQRFQLMPLMSQFNGLATQNNNNNNNNIDHEGLKRPSLADSSVRDDLQTQTSVLFDSPMRGPFELEQISTELPPVAAATQSRDPIESVETSAEADSNLELMTSTGPSPSISPGDTASAASEPDSMDADSLDDDNEIDDFDFHGGDSKAPLGKKGAKKGKPKHSTSASTGEAPSLTNKQYEQPTSKSSTTNTTSSQQVSEPIKTTTTTTTSIGHELLVGPFKSEAEAPATITLSGVVYQKSGSSSPLLSLRPPAPIAPATSSSLKHTNPSGQDKLASFMLPSSFPVSASTASSSRAKPMTSAAAAKQPAWPYVLGLPSSPPAADLLSGNYNNNNIILGSVKSTPTDGGLPMDSLGSPESSNLRSPASSPGDGQSSHEISIGLAHAHQLKLASPTDTYAAFPGGIRALSLSDLALASLGGGAASQSTGSHTKQQQQQLVNSLPSNKLLQFQQDETLSSSSSGQDPRGTTTVWVSHHLGGAPRQQQQSSLATSGGGLASGSSETAQLVASESQKHNKDKPIVIVQKDVKPVKYHLLRAYLKLRRLLRPSETTYVFPNEPSGFIRRLWHKRRQQ